MHYEVELKFPLSNCSEVQSRLRDLGAYFDPSIEQCDRYFNHPARDFAVTDEAFRIRSVGLTNVITYKRPVLDQSTRMRHEIEIAIAEGTEAASQMSELWTNLGFRFVHEVRKSRTPWHLNWNQQDYELAIDFVPHLGTFLEIELVVDDTRRNEARDAVLNLAAKLGLSNPERRSYLEMVVAANRH